MIDAIDDDMLAVGTLFGDVPGLDLGNEQFDDERHGAGLATPSRCHILPARAAVAW